MKLKKPKEFTIDRSKWVQGGHKFKSILGASKLLNNHGNMCCLGFYSKACGVPDKELENPVVACSIRCSGTIHDQRGRHL